MQTQTISIYYATESGNAESLAGRTGEKLKSLGHVVTVKNVNDVPADSLTNGGKVIFVVSTWGEGEPPYSAEDFAKAVCEGNMDLGNLSFTVLALGDTAYDDFCGFGRKLEEALLRQGGKSFMERKNLDIDFDKEFQQWSETLTTTL
jgi:sulfite reductase (NADPH) flavoprotein alpha-component